jgi:hypothetical protein
LNKSDFILLPIPALSLIINIMIMLPLIIKPPVRRRMVGSDVEHRLVAAISPESKQEPQ